MMTSQSKKQAFPELRGKLSQIRYPAYIEPKIDGELNWYYAPAGPPGSGEIGMLVNKSGKQRYGMPIAYDLDKIQAIWGLELLGELYWNDGKSGDLYEVLKHQNSDNLKYMVFDIDIPGTYLQRRALLEQIIKPTQHVTLIQKFVVNNEREVRDAFTWWTRAGFEGIVVKNADSRLIMGPCGWVKMKKKDQSDYMVIHIDPHKERIQIAVPITHIVVGDTPFGGQSEFAYVGVKVNHKDKTKLRLGDKVTIEHQGVLSSGGLRHPVFKGKV